jgi:hypothetical protein
MSRLRVHSFAISLDGYGAGPDQDLGDPLAAVRPDEGRASPLAFMLHIVSLWRLAAADGPTPDLLNARRFDVGEHESVT